MNNEISRLSGVVAYMVTPFCSDTGEIDFITFDSLIERLIDSKVEAIAVLGCAGECPYLSDKEWERIVEHAVAVVAKRVPLIVGVSELTITQARNKAQSAEREGVDIVMLSQLKQYEISDKEIYSYFETVAEAISIPIMLYNNPGICGIDISAELMFSMVSHIENIKLIKESSPNLAKLHKLNIFCQSKVALFVGCNYLAFDALKLGVDGWCTAAPNLLGSLPSQLCHLLRKGEENQAKKIFLTYKPLLSFLVEKGLARTVKAGLELQGIYAGLPRKPVEPLSQTEVKMLSALLLQGE